jgi:hypothetical protein
MGTTATQTMPLFNLRKTKSRIPALEDGHLRPGQAQMIAKRLGVTEQEVIDMNRRLGGRGACLREGAQFRLGSPCSHGRKHRPRTSLGPLRVARGK